MMSHFLSGLEKSLASENRNISIFFTASALLVSNA